MTASASSHLHPSSPFPTAATNGGTHSELTVCLDQLHPVSHSPSEPVLLVMLHVVAMKSWGPKALCVWHGNPVALAENCAV